MKFVCAGETPSIGGWERWADAIEAVNIDTAYAAAQEIIRMNLDAPTFRIIEKSETGIDALPALEFSAEGGTVAGTLETSRYLIWDERLDA